MRITIAWGEFTEEIDITDELAQKFLASSDMLQKRPADIIADLIKGYVGEMMELANRLGDGTKH